MKIKGIIKAVTGPKEFNGDLQIGFMVNDKWYNVCSDEDNLRRIKETILKKGNEIEFEFAADKKFVVEPVVITEAKEEKKPEKGGDDMLNFDKLLGAAHKKGLTSIRTECLSVDLEKKYALFKAVVIGDVGKEAFLGEFTGHGDATADNITGEHIKKHFIRMAETRAICRALRWYTNNATCSEEEK